MSLVVEPLAGTDVVRVSRWIFNCYVVPGDDGPVVVDAGLPGAAEDLAPVLAGSRGALQAVVATHGHSDHVAGAARLAARHGDAPVHLPETTLTHLSGATLRPPTGRAVASIWPTLADQRLDARAVQGLTAGARIAGFGTTRGMVWTGPAPAGGLADGRPLPGASAWTVLAVPGHTDDSVAFWHAGTRTLLSGDAVLSARGRAWLTPELVDTGAAEVSAARLPELPVQHLLPGHGRPVHGDDVWAHRRR